jgi:hypothetical protein
MGMGFGPVGSLPGLYREGAGCGVEEGKKMAFSGLTAGVVFLLGAGLCSLR